MDINSGQPVRTKEKYDFSGCYGRRLVWSRFNNRGLAMVLHKKPARRDIPGWKLEVCISLGRRKPQGGP